LSIPVKTDGMPSPEKPRHDPALPLSARAVSDGCGRFCRFSKCPPSSVHSKNALHTPLLSYIKLHGDLPRPCGTKMPRMHPFPAPRRQYSIKMSRMRRCPLRRLSLCPDSAIPSRQAWLDNHRQGGL